MMAMSSRLVDEYTDREISEVGRGVYPQSQLERKRMIRQSVGGTVRIRTTKRVPNQTRGFHTTAPLL